MLAGIVVVFVFVFVFAFAAVVVAVTAIAVVVVDVAVVDVGAVAAVVAATATDAAGGCMVVALLLAFWPTSLAMESDWCICGLLECKIFVKPPPVNEPFGESFVTTTDGARTRRGLNMADTSLSRVISHKHTPKSAAVLLHTNQILNKLLFSMGQFSYSDTYCYHIHVFIKLQSC